MNRMKGNKGVALVEMAIVLPFLILLVFGIIEFSFILYDKAMITNASREGARVGIVFKVDGGGYVSPLDRSADIEKRIQNYLQTYLINLGAPSTALPSLGNGIALSVEPNDSGELSPGGKLRVDVTYDYSFLVFSAFSGGKVAPQVSLSATTIMWLE